MTMHGVTLSDVACTHIAELMAPAFSEILSSISHRFADAMVRVRGRRALQRKLPLLTREMSVTPKRRRRSGVRVMSSLAAKIDTKVPLSVGRGREAERSASLVSAPAKVHHVAGPDSRTVAAGW